MLEGQECVSKILRVRPVGRNLEVGRLDQVAALELQEQAEADAIGAGEEVVDTLVAAEAVMVVEAVAPAISTEPFLQIFKATVILMALSRYIL